MDDTRKIVLQNQLKELLPFLADGSFKELNEFFNLSIYQKISQGKIISVEGSACNHFSFLLKGQIRVYKVGVSGREITLYRIEEGSSCILTASCILSSKLFPAIAIAEKNSEVLSLPANLFKEWVNKYSVWQQYVFNLVSERLDNVITIVEEIAFKQVDIRLAEKLAKLSNDKTFSIMITHQELASEIGTSREVVSRILKDFEERGILSLSRGTIKILSTEKLTGLRKK
jgi:CRP/FNR family transcriptional regulator